MNAKLAPIAFAEVVPRNLLADVATVAVVPEAIRHGASVMKRTRSWHVSRSGEHERRFFGRLGFISTHQAVSWDDDLAEFRQQVVDDGQTATFLFDPRTALLAFQVRPGVIDAQEFVRTFEALLNAGSAAEEWSVYQLRREVEFDEWVEEVDSVVEIDFRLERPNPHYGDDKLVEEILGNSDADVAELRLKSDENAGGISTRSEIVRQSVHFGKKYGSISARGLRGLAKSFWNSKASKTSLQLERPVDEAGEVPAEGLGDALDELGK